MTFYRIASALMGYPDASLRDDLPEILTAIHTEGAAGGMTDGERHSLSGFCERLSGSDPLVSEADYVRTFDMTPEHSLHLTHHLIGEDKNRGPALIDLTEFYREYGVEITEKELPDYLPLMLEFVSTLEAEEGRLFLSRWNKVLRQLVANLTEASCPYAELIGLIEMRSRLVDTDITIAATPRTDPLQDDGDFDPPIHWAQPSMTGAFCTA
ncbi:MAG: nitrate reductase molybdenum cofactor assembly chaperone [Rhodocyclaceae bacterium]|nr:nitrate reductase molybdenum cofactor assembly chaperone [Rhodocyclaceae bacterium]